MHEQLDSDLTKRIASVFETYEDPGANEGWLLLREKFPVRESRRGLLWFWLGAAALLMLALGVGLWRYSEQTQSTPIAAKNSKNNFQNKSIAEQTLKSNTDNRNTIARQKTDSTGKRQILTSSSIAARADKYITRRNTDSTLPVDRMQNEPLAKRRSQHIVPKNLTEAHGQSFATSKNNSQLKEKNTKVDVKQLFTRKKTDSVETSTAPANTPEVLSASTNINRIRPKSRSSAHDKKLPGSAADSLEDTPDENLTAKRKVVEKDEVLTVHDQKFSMILSLKTVIILLPDEKSGEAKKSIYAMFAADDKKPKDEITGKNKKVQFGIYEATYLNYAKGSDNQVNLGVGLSSDIYFSKNLKLSSGVSVGRNSFNYSGNTTLNTTQYDYAVAAQTTLVTAANHTSSNFTPATALRNYNAGLVDLDIPVNLKYEFNTQNNNLYIATGLSSGTFVSETYNYQYNYQASSIPYNQQTLATTTNKSFNSFYFAKTINIAFGAGLPFGKNRLFFEPFLKYPIGGLGSQEIHFGSTGLNLKFKFH